MTRPHIGAADHAPLPRSTGSASALIAPNHSKIDASAVKAACGPTGGAGASNAATLPKWAKPHASLIADIIAEQPERNKVTTETCMGPASYGYRGRNAARLRMIYAATFTDMLTWVGAVEHDSAEYHQRRNALIAFDKANNADAVIARGMGL